MLFGKHINKYYLKYAPLFLIGIAALVAVDYYQLFIPEYLGDLVDLCRKAEADSTAVDSAILGEILKGVIVVAFVMFLGRVAWRLSIFNASQRIEAGIRHQMFLKSERLSQRFFHENKVGAIMAWYTNDLESVEEFLGWGTVMLVDAFFLSILVIVKMCSLDLIMTLVLAVPLVLIIIWGALVEKYMAMRWTQRQEAFDKLYDFSQESFTGIRVIKAFVKETHQLHEFARVAKKNKDVNIRFVKVSVLFDVIIEIMIALIMSVLIGLGGYFVYCGATGNPFVLFGHTVELSAGKLITFIGYFDTLVWPMIAMGQIISMRSRAGASLKRISAFLDQEEEICDPESPVTLENVRGEISFRNFSFTYPNASHTELKNITLDIKAGETIGVIGKIGSGKTTLVNSLLRLYNLEKGTVFIDGHDIMDCTLDSVRSAVAYVPQDNFLFSDKVRNNIAFSDRTAPMEKVIDAAKFAGVDGDIEDFKDQYDTITGERGVTMSGGQKQRVSLARAYLKDAPIMILDDSVSAVDVRTEETILHNIKEKREGKTTIVIASRVSTVSRMSRVLVLNNGEAEAFDTPENLMKTSPTYQKMVYLQTLEKEVEGA